MASKGVSRIDPEGSLAKRKHNHDCSTAILKERGFTLEAKNNNTHYIVTKDGVTADFWPTTGQYCLRGTKSYKRGVFNLLRDMEKKNG